MASIGLCMIVRNAASTLERCLTSVLPLIDYACIVDTGSDDETVRVVRHFFQKHRIRHDIYRDTWRDFSSNRNAAMDWMRHRGDVDYYMVLAADDVVCFSEAFDVHKFKEQMGFDVYDAQVHEDGAQCDRPVLFEANLGCYYRGKIHEFLVIPAHATRCEVTAFHLESTRGPSDRDRAAYLSDAGVIEEALREETDPFMLSRYHFYLGQSYMRGGDFKKAIKAFYARVQCGGWEQELFISLLCIARMMAGLNYREERVIHAYFRAWSVCPERAEPLYDLAAYARKNKHHHWARLFAGKGMQLEKPTRGLRIEHDIYTYKLLEEYVNAAYGCGDYSESLEACTRLLKQAALPASERGRAMTSAINALERLRSV
ncbi:glycosyltransferase [Dyella monticola]|nr:glycosyltransferase [Dyella monticola]